MLWLLLFLDSALVSRPCKHAGVTCAPSTFLLNFVETCLSAMTHPLASLHQYPLVPFFATLLLMFHHGTIILQYKQTVILVLPLVSILRGEAGQLSLRCTSIFVMFSIASCRWPFLSTALPVLPFLNLSSGNPPILAVVFSVSAPFLFRCLRSFR